MNYALALDPLLPIWALAAVMAAAALGAAAAGFARPASLPARGAALAVLGVLLLNPALMREDRDALPDIVVAVTDRSASMTVGDRRGAADAALSRLRQAAENDPTLDLVTAETRGDGETRLFEALERAAADVPADRFAGAILITDGLAHDAPDGAARAPGPVHAVIVGDPQARDRRLEVSVAPNFAVVGETATFEVAVIDPTGTPARLTAQFDGVPLFDRLVRPGAPVKIEAPIERSGAAVMEFRVDAGPEELTLSNNQSAVSLTAVRDRLRVLLVSGEPHPGERTWRDLLKADPSVDLVHFTILRPLSKLDATPTNELALIAFPAEELFREKLDEFDLIIFDRYRRRAGVLSQAYLDNVARYVENGGALLVAAGPAFAGVYSLYRTPLAAVLPARPTGGIAEAGFRPQLSDDGHRHPISGALHRAPADEDGPNWGRWFRVIDVRPIAGRVLMTDEDQRPLLMVDRVGEGRVAQLLSDHIWLWARGYEGGGPQAEMLRRLAHWLMGEPELEEEALRLEARDGELVAERRTMADAPPETVVTDPSGVARTIQMTQIESGLWRGQTPVTAQGLHRAASGELTTVAAAGPLNPKEFMDIRATAARVAPAVTASGGGAFFVGDRSGRSPNIRRVAPDRVASGGDWIGLVRHDRFRVRDVSETPAFPWWAALPLIFALIAVAWRLESR